MKDLKDVKNLNEAQENLNISDVNNSYSCKDCKIISDAEDIDELSTIVIKHLKDWKNGKYKRDGHYLRNLASDLQSIDVLFNRDIEKE